MRKTSPPCSRRKATCDTTNPDDRNALRRQRRSATPFTVVLRFIVAWADRPRLEYLVLRNETTWWIETFASKCTVSAHRAHPVRPVPHPSSDPSTDARSPLRRLPTHRERVPATSAA